MSRSAFVSHVMKINFERLQSVKLYSTCRISLALTAISLVGLATSLPAAAAKMGMDQKRVTL